LKFRYFKIEDFSCHATGENEIKQEFVIKLDELRDLCGFPFVITSGYRSKEHGVEAVKLTPGTHNEGIAADIKVSNGTQRRAIVKNAIAMGFNGIGVAKTFVHVDSRRTAPVIWTY
jgi:uncharacterized protein YcbK (DUF882 family)